MFGSNSFFVRFDNRFVRQLDFAQFFIAGLATLNLFTHSVNFTLICDEHYVVAVGIERFSVD